MSFAEGAEGGVREARQYTRVNKGLYTRVNKGVAIKGLSVGAMAGLVALHCL